MKTSLSSCPELGAKLIYYNLILEAVSVYAEGFWKQDAEETVWIKEG
jgi:hypothetical protein